MVGKARRTAIDIIGDVSWGTHFCQFYQTKEDLIDILVPYFKAGLENNEFCMWITSEPLNAEDAKSVLKKEVRNLDDYIKTGQMEILDYSRWYTKSGHFDSDRVLQGWVEKEEQALKKGFDGLRLTGNTFWLVKKDWESFKDYEVAVNGIIGKHRMLACCTYSLDKCTALEVLDVVSNHQFALIKREGKWEIIESAEHKNVIEELQVSEANYRTIFDSANDAIFVHDIESGKILSANQKACEMFGYTREELTKLAVEDISIGLSPYDRAHAIEWLKKAAEKGPQLFEWIGKHETGQSFWIEVNLKLAVIEGRDRILAIVRDITERKNVEEPQQLVGRILKCLNRESAGSEVINDVLALVKESTGFAAVGIRLHEGDDFPYFVTKGFSEDFIRAENHLCVRDKNGKQIYNSQGNPVLECMCGNVLSGRTDPALPFFTKGGSFWTNCTTKLLESTPPENLQVQTRNRCNEAGYESVALIPLRSGDQIVGLLQLNDTWPGRFTPEMIDFFEGICSSIGIAMARIRAEEDIKNLAKFPSEDPNPVLRIAKNGELLYANAASESFLAEWGCRAGQAVPGKWRQIVSEVFALGSGKGVEIEHAGKIFSFMVAPVVEAGYANLYGWDITERKQAEENLKKYHDQLEELIQTRTAELRNANKKLLQQIKQRERLEKEILSISEREQRLIGQELHDSIGQQFTGIAFMTKVLEQKLATELPDEASNAAKISQLVNQAMEQTKSLAKSLHPVDLDSTTLLSVLQELAATTENLFGVRCTVRCSKAVAIDDTEVSVHLYRITQEAITNAVKHGRAKNIHISLACGKDKYILTIKSDGLDFPKEFEERGTGMGLQIMDYRAEIIGGYLAIHKAAKGGTIVTCKFPNKKH